MGYAPISYCRTGAAATAAAAASPDYSQPPPPPPQRPAAPGHSKAGTILASGLPRHRRDGIMTSFQFGGNF